jgi:release factor glutamine methyltransferase
MKTAIKHIVAHTYRPLLVRYLSKTRSYRYGDIVLEVPPQVFHPGFFFSTKILMNYINHLELQGKNFLELGCGSGLISIQSAKNTANVTSTDINPVAIEFLRKNADRNKVTLNIILSDLFANIPRQQFDVIAINPPFYKKKPQTELEYAWFCGENGEYFSELFGGLGNYMHEGSEVLMILFEGCDLEMIENMASGNGFNLRCVFTKKNLLEKNFIYKIEKVK